MGSGNGKEKINSLLKNVYTKINARHGHLMYNFIHGTNTIGCLTVIPNNSCYQSLLLYKAENARSTLSQPALQMRHDHVTWPMESKDLLGSPRKDFSPWKETKEVLLFPLLPAFEHSYLRKLWLKLWKPSCDYNRKAKKIKRSHPKPTLRSCYKSHNHPHLAFLCCILN